MKDMKNVKPAYAVNLGTGVFMGTMWQCSKCGKTTMTSNSLTKPIPTFGGRCPSTASGNHMWRQY